jgi:hypothetical protein
VTLHRDGKLLPEDNRRVSGRVFAYQHVELMLGVGFDYFALSVRNIITATVAALSLIKTGEVRFGLASKLRTASRSGRHMNERRVLHPLQSTLPRRTD